MILALLAAACAPQAEDEPTPSTQPPAASGGSDSAGSVTTGISRSSTSEFQGSGTTPFAGVLDGRRGIYTITSDTDQTTGVVFVDRDGGTATTVATLPAPTMRSYADGFQLSSGTLAVLYQSSNYWGQTGEDQGVVFVGLEDGSQLDRGFYADGLTRPEASVEFGDWAVLAFSNGGIELSDAGLAFPVVPYAGPSSLVIIPLSDLSATVTILDVDGTLNASSLATVDSNDGTWLALGASGGNVLVEGAAASLTLIDPDTLESETSFALPGGQGLELDVSGDMVLSSGTTYSGDSLSLVNTTSGDVQTLNLFDLDLPLAGSPDYGDVYVLDAAFTRGGQILVNLSDEGVSKLFVIDPNSRNFEEVHTITASFSSTFAELDDEICLVASGTRSATEAEVAAGVTPGTIYSEVVCYAE